MHNNERSKKCKRVTEQAAHIEKCWRTLNQEIAETIEEQERDPWDNYMAIRNHTMFQNDIRYIRRQLMKLSKMLEE